MTKPLTDEVIAEMCAAYENEAEHDAVHPEPKAMRAAAKVIESALAGDGQDAERYRHVRNDASETYALCRGRWDQDRMIWRFVEVIEREEADNLIDADIAAIKGKSHD